MDTLESDNIDEFITIIQLLEDKDLSVLYQVLLFYELCEFRKYIYTTNSY